MIKKYADEKHQTQAEAFIFSLGSFTLEFERACEAMRYIIMFMLRSQGLNNQGMEQVIVGDKAAAELQVLLGALYFELPNQDQEDQKAVKILLKAIKELTERRNILLHNSWSFGDTAGEEELIAAAIRYRAKQTKGGEAEVHGYSSAYLDGLAAEAKRIQLLLQRLQYCVCQNGFKVSTEFAKPM